jgi:hypothetical protein
VALGGLVSTFCFLLLLELMWNQSRKGARDAARHSRNEAGTTDRKIGGRKMGFLFIFLSLIFLSADLPLGFLAACDQSRLLHCKEGKRSSDQ